ncbi:MAG: hypothetical protein DWQ37_22050 [Planctomycetota bacterium]|nr:MAG: hypothetical protein DWQ37_22050 [Planctomycetota bacterium]
MGLGLGLAGCCAGPERFYENAYGFNNPDIEKYPPGPPPPVTTPPGYSEPAVSVADTETPEEGPVPALQAPVESRRRPGRTALRRYQSGEQYADRAPTYPWAYRR